MARSISEIYDEMVNEKQSFSSLNGLLPTGQINPAQELLTQLTTASKVAIWRLQLWVVATGIFTIETLMDTFKADVTALSDVLITGTTRWLAEESKKFQVGDTLVFINGIYKYSVINTSLQIVQRASAKEGANGSVLLKVAKLTGGIPEKLTVAELNSFKGYIDQIKGAGVLVIVISDDPDELIVNYKIYYDPLVLSPTGESLSAPGTFPVEDNINSFIGNLDFDGVLNITKMTDSIQSVSGVKDPVFQSASARFGAFPFLPITDNYESNAGYMVISPANPLNTTLTYIDATSV
jgi:hypothetical protein